VVVTGGPSRADFASFLAMVGQALEAGAAGTCVGRNVLQHPDPREALKRLAAVVHKDSGDVETDRKDDGEVPGRAATPLS
jgi:DhnA family fructose-bisphosphate aldolase class Ia